MWRQMRSPHILGTASILLGLCLIVQTSLRISARLEASLIDEFTGAASVLLMFACMLSFLSLRSKNEARAESMERTSDITFIGALAIVFASIVLISFTLPDIAKGQARAVYR